jgi:hypothetical protein
LSDCECGEQSVSDSMMIAHRVHVRGKSKWRLYMHDRIDCLNPLSRVTHKDRRYS